MINTAPLLEHLAVLPAVCTNTQRNIICAYARGHRFTHYLGLDGPTLTVQKMDNDEFDKEFEPWEKHTTQDFAVSYVKSRSSMISLSEGAHKVLKAIITNSPIQPDDEVTQLLKENEMAKAEGGFRKPDGVVAQVHAYLDSKLEQIKKGTISRKELLEALEAKDINVATATTQCGVWARENGIVFARPTQAAEAKKEVRAKARKAKAKAKAVPA